MQGFGSRQPIPAAQAAAHKRAEKTCNSDWRNNKTASDNNSIQSIDAAKMGQSQVEKSERRMRQRQARNAWERVTGFFGAKHMEECPSSVRRRMTVTTQERNALGVKNTLYFINLSPENTTTVQIACRVRDQSTLIAANISVAPLDYGEWEPPCACEKDYKFWCTLASPEPIAAHAIAAQTSGGRKSLEYIDFFLGR